MQVKDVMKAIQEIAPFEWAEERDHVGLLVGDESQTVTRIAIVLDADGNRVEAAKGLGADLIVTHHPFIYDPIQSVNLKDPFSKTLVNLLRTGISLISVHTNWDLCPTGGNVSLGKALGLRNMVPFGLPKGRENSGTWGFGTLGMWSDPVALSEIPRLLRERWGLSWVRLYGLPERRIERVALSSGAGGAFWKEALASSAELFITADFSYHATLEALERGLAIGVVDHGEMERATLPDLLKQLEERLDVPIFLLQSGLPLPLL